MRGVGDGMDNSETEGEDSSLVKWGGQKVAVRMKRSEGDLDTQRRKDKVTD